MRRHRGYSILGVFIPLLLVYVLYPLINRKLSFRSIMGEDTPTTFAYKKLGDLTLYIDVYPPTTTTTTTDSSGPVPAVVFFHGGGMTTGDRTSWLPKWLIRRTTAAGLAFISADYRLMPPSTARCTPRRRRSLRVHR